MPNTEPPEGRNENAEQPELHQQQRNNNDAAAEQRNGQQPWYLNRRLVHFKDTLAKIAVHPLTKIAVHPLTRYLGGILLSLFFVFIFTPMYGLYEERKFEKFISNTECSYTQLCIQQDFCKKGGTPITEDMYNNTPILIPTSFEELNTKSTTTAKQGHIQITNTFPVDMEDASKRLFAIIGEPGSGKSVYLETFRSYYIKQGFFPFLVTFKRLASMKNEVNFPQFLLKCVGPGFKFSDPETFVTWIRKNKKKIIILADGLDEHYSLILENVYEMNIMESSTTSDKLISLLFYGKIHEMEEIKVLFTSRPSSILNLPHSSRPDVYYSMNGFANTSLSGVLRKYIVKSDDVHETLRFIERKGSKFMKFARNPFVLALISLTYKTTSIQITPKTTLTQLYEHAFEEKRRSLHSRGSWTIETEKEVDKFFYIYFFKKDKVTAKDINEHNQEEDRKLKQRGDNQRSKDQHLTLEKLESYSMLKIASKRSSAYIEETDEIIAPMHQTVMDFHIARYVISQMDITQFETLVQEMFSGKEEDRWVMIRRFISGLINRTEVDKDKIRIFNEQYVRTLNESISQDYTSLYDQLSKDEVIQTGILQGHLYNDLLEFNDEQVRSIKEKFFGKLVHLFVIMNDDTSIEGQTYFVRNIKPHLEELKIVIGDVEPTDFIHFTEAVEDLPNKIKDVSIVNISPFHGHVEAIGRIFSNTEYVLHMQYQVEDGDFEDIKKQLQAQMDKLKSTNARVGLVHRGRRHLIRQSSSGNVECFKYNQTSDIWEISTFDIFDTDLPTNIGKKFAFTISTNPQLKKLYEILNEFRSNYVRKLDLYIPSDVEWNHIHSLIENIKNMEYKVGGIFIYNLLLSEVDIDETLSLISDVSNVLLLNYLDELTDDEKVEIWNKLPPVSSLPSELKVLIDFNNFRVVRIGDEWELKILRNR